MDKILISSVLCIVLLTGYAGAQEGQIYQDLARGESADSVTTYRIGESGMCGLLKGDHILVAHVIPESPATGKIQPGDRIRRLQYRSLGSDIRKTVATRIFRLGRDWDWQLFVTLERPSLNGNSVIVQLSLPPTPGLVYHYGPTGFFAKRYPDHLIVDSIETGSPADGTLRVGDKIVAVDGQPITRTVFQQFAAAVDRVESMEEGRLGLQVARPATVDWPAQELALQLQLKVLGSYRKTAPLDCPKTDAIINQTANKLIETENYGRLNIGLLGLLATGDLKHLAHVGRTVRSSDFSAPDYSFSPGASYVSWKAAYNAIILCEYYLLSKDDYVLPAIQTHARIIARGQDAAGLWNHRMADPEANFGQLHGRLYGYGAINQTSVPLWIALILAEKCGVEDAEVRAAIEKSHAFYQRYIGNSALPYGSDPPEQYVLSNNGTSGSVAVAFGLLGNSRGARFYARMSAAAADEILTGHTGPYFSILWSGLGANVAGPGVTAAYAKRLHWLRTATRAWDGRFFSMAAWGTSPKPGKLSDSGAYLLNLCSARRSIQITGKEMSPTLWVSGESAEKWVEAATIDEPDEAELLSLLGSPLPIVQIRAAQLLTLRDAKIEKELRQLLANGTREERIGALRAISSLNVTSAIDELVAMVENEENDLWTRQLAAKTLAEMDAAKPRVPELLKALLADKPYDAYRDLDQSIGSALVSILAPDPYAAGLDKDLFYASVSKLLDHPDHLGRQAGMALLRNIPIQDFYRVADKMVYVIEDRDRTYTAYHGDLQRQMGLEILYRLGIKESIDLTINTIKEPTGRGARVRSRKEFLKTFGAEAKYAIPVIRDVLGKDADEIVTAIEASTSARKMISLEQAKLLRE